MKSRTTYETPEALRHDLQQLAASAQSLFEATGEIADEKITAARKKLSETLHLAGERYARCRERAAAGCRATTRAVETHPFLTAAVALGLGVVIGHLSRHDNPRT
jgi:ElaB/YqjD/DUF883 family membrane-anchored ribosome-binding protein